MMTGMKNEEIKESLEEAFGSTIRFDEPMWKHTSLRVGGPADIFAEPETRDELIRLVRFCNTSEIPCFILGAGTNLLILDGGFRGCVVTLRHCGKDIRVDDKSRGDMLFYADAGILLPVLVARAIREGCSGLNRVAGIPGTVGGAVLMNAGTKRGSIGDILEAVTVLFRDGTVDTIKKKNFQTSYRSFSLTSQKSGKRGENEFIILDASVRLQVGEASRIKREAELLMAERKRNQPLNTFNAGCFFKNPESGDSAGKLIELAGLKGKTIGGAKISEKHANFIINQKNATARDIVQLMELIKMEVFHRFAVALRPEVRVIGNAI